MRVPKFLKFFMSILLCVALFRTAIGADEISLHDILVEIQGFDFGFDSITELINDFQNSTFTKDLVWWNSSLEGVSGIIENIFNCIISFFQMIASVISSIVVCCWNLIVDMFQLIGDIFSLIFHILGITEYNGFNDAYRGGR